MTPHAQSSLPVLVTGADGLVGRNLCRLLEERGQTVTRFDRNATTGQPSVVGDVRDAELVDRLVAESSAVLHMAAVVGVDRYVRDPASVIDVNYMGTRLVAEACLRHDRPLLLASTSEVYGRTGGVLTETTTCTYGAPPEPRWAYALSKAAAENVVASAVARGLRGGIVRYFNVYGPNDGARRVIERFCERLREGQPLQLVGGGHAIRSFCWVGDATKATLRVLDAIADGKPHALGKPVNIGRDEPVSMRELAARIQRVAGREVGTASIAGEAFFGAGFAEIDTRVPSLARLRDDYGFEAETPLDDGLRATLAAALPR